MNYRVLLFYKYVPVENPQAVVDEHLQWCLQNDIKGRVFIADEGVNGTVSGTKENIEKYKAQLGSYPGFKDIWFKEDEAEEHTFFKMHVRVKKEIVYNGDVLNTTARIESVCNEFGQQLIASVVGGMKAPIFGFVSGLGQIARSLVSVLDQIQKKKS